MPVNKPGDGAGGAGARIKGDSLFGSILKEEEELEMIKALPADSSLRQISNLDSTSHFLIIFQSYEAEAFGRHDCTQVRDAED